MVKFIHQSPNLRHDLFEDGNLEADWLAGLVAADGCVASNGHSWSFSQSGPSGLQLMEDVTAVIRYEASISSYKPSVGKVSHSITVTSPRMVAALADVYAVTPRKTTSLRWPGLTGERAAAFLRGYIDGDGSIGVYRVGRTPAMLLVSFVGTTAFVDAAVDTIPVPGRTCRIKRCVDLVDARWSGRYGWALGQWVYQHSSSLPVSAKFVRFAEYGFLVAHNPPAWMTSTDRRSRVHELLAAGVLPMQVAELTGERFQTVYRWRAAARKPGV